MDVRVSERRQAVLAYLVSALNLDEPSEELVDLLVGGSRMLNIGRGGLICYADAEPPGCFWIVAGTVKLSLIGRDGTERVLALLDPGCSFGEPALWMDRPDRLCAEAIGETLLLQVGRAAMLGAASQFQELAGALLRCISGQTLRLLDELYNSAFLNARDRVVQFLLEQVDPSAGVGPRSEIRLPACKALTAAALDMTAETFSREIHGLARAGLLTVEHRTIRVHDPDGLRRILPDASGKG